jgi:hypothetical protein
VKRQFIVTHTLRHMAILALLDSLVKNTASVKCIHKNLLVLIQGAYKLSDYFAKLDHRCIFCYEIVHITFGSTSQEDHDFQIAVGTRVEPPQIPGHTNYVRSVRQQFPSNTGLRFSREMAVAIIGPFQKLRSLCVIDTNFTILRHFLRNPPIIYNHSVYIWSNYTLDMFKTYLFQADTNTYCLPNGEDLSIHSIVMF